MMKPTFPFFAFALLQIVLLEASSVAMTVDIPAAGMEFIKVGDEWRFFRGTKPPSDPPDAWKDKDFNDGDWERGISGFGYGDDDDETILTDMEDNYVSLYIRKEFTLPSPVGEGVLQLVIDYDDGFIAYLNGDLVASEDMPDPPVDFETEASSHEAGTPIIIPLGNAVDFLDEGKNVLAIEGHNTSIGSTDFSLIPALRMTTDIVREGETWIVGSDSLVVAGVAPLPQTALVTVNDAEVAFSLADGTWEAEVALTPGRNEVVAEAFDLDGILVDSGSAEIIYVPPSHRVSGEIVAETTWSSDPSPYVIEETVVVQPGAVLRIEAGTRVMLKDAASLIVFGQLLAEGSEDKPIFFTHYGDGNTWGSIVFEQAEASRLAHCTVEYSSSAASYGGNDYLAAVAVVGSHLDVDRCVLQKLPDDSSTAEGDGINLSAGSTANISNSRFLSIGEGVHTNRCYVLVENCLFTDIRGDNDGVGLEEESDPVPVIRNNSFIGSQDDALHPDRCSAIITGNVVTGCNDHGIVLRNKCQPYLANNLVYNCRVAGIAIENQCDALLVNNTIVNCDRGLRLFHLEREGSDPGGGYATVRNCIIWNCPQRITLEDGSEVTVSYSLINGSAPWEGEGNLNVDPLFVDAAAGDFHLTKFSPCIDVGDGSNAPADDFDGNPRPRGTGVDLGAFESPYWPWIDSDDDGMADGWETVYFTDLSAKADGDFDGDGMKNVTEYDLGAHPGNNDTDSDGLADGWEWSYGFNPLLSTGDDGSDGDPDKDGFPNLSEQVAGTDPTDPASLFRVDEVPATNDSFGLRWDAKSGREYRVLASSDLQLWTQIEVIPPRDDRLAEWFDNISTEIPYRFYRLEVRSAE